MFKELGLYTEKELDEIVATITGCVVEANVDWSMVRFIDVITNELVFTYEPFENAYFKGFMIHDFRKAL